MVDPAPNLISVQTLVASLITNNEDGLSEKDTRTIIVGLHKQPDFEKTFYRHLAMQDFKSITSVALKVLSLTNRLMLYCPEIT